MASCLRINDGWLQNRVIIKMCWRKSKTHIPTESLAQHAHRIFQTFEGEGEHAVADHLLDDADALAVLPHAQGLGVDPSELGVGVGQAL